MKAQLVGTLVAGVWIAAGLCQTPPQPDPGPVQAELLANLDVHHLVIGKTIFARVTQDWKGQDCALREGAVLEGTVEESVRRAGKDESKLALSFKQAQCNGRDIQPMDLVLTVIARPASATSNAANLDFPMTMQIPNPHPIGPTANPQSTLATGQNTSMLNYNLTQLTLSKLESSGIAHRFPAHKNIRPGDVLDMKGVSLGIGKGPNRSTVISAKGSDVYIAQFAQILLVPPAVAFRSSPARIAVTGPARSDAAVASARPAPVAAPPVPLPNDIEICAPPGCAVDLPVTTQELKGPSASSIATRALGYTPPVNKALARFADEESLVWLGQNQLLFAFNPHHLIRRGKGDQSGTARLIRAVLLDTATRNVIRAVDWEIADSHRYLWPLDNDRILVHVGSELRVYGPGLEVERTVALAGPLMFVRIAPGGSLLAVATLRERHSAELHTKLRDESGGEPEEDVDVAILNSEFKTVAQASAVSTLMAPTLLDEGQVRLQSEPGQWYRLALITWENKRSALGRFQSACTPEVTSTAPDLLFLLTCGKVDGTTQYSVVRPDGKTLLRGISDSQEIGHEAMGNHRSGTFAVKIVHSDRSILPSTVYTSSDLDFEEVRVYRAQDGKRLLAVRAQEPIASHGGYALSPDGSQLAVLSGSEIKFYPVPAE